MKLKWTLPVRLVPLTAAAQMLSFMVQFMQEMETNMTKTHKGMGAAPRDRRPDHGFAVMMRPRREGANPRPM